MPNLSNTSNLSNASNLSSMDRNQNVQSPSRTINNMKSFGEVLNADSDDEMNTKLEIIFITSIRLKMNKIMGF